MENISTKKLAKVAVFIWVTLLVVAITLSFHSAKRQKAEKDRAGSSQSVTGKI